MAEGNGKSVYDQWVTTVFGVAVGPAARKSDGPVPAGSVAPGTQAAKAWEQALAGISTDIDNLNSQIRRRRGDDPRYPAIVERMRGLAGVADSFRDLGEALSSPDIADQAGQRRVVKLALRHMKRIAGDTLILLVDSNPFLDIDLGSRLSSALGAVISGVKAQ